jgi:flagellar motility protein MotE (MotC chaperone)
MIRALPILIIFTVIMMGSKLLELFEVLPDFFAARAIHASDEAPKEEKKSEEKKHEEGEKKAEGEGHGEEKKSEEAPKEGEKKEGDAHGEEKKEGEKKEAEGGHGEGDKKEGKLETYTKKPDSVVAPPPEFSKSEMDVLQELSKRREELDEREKDISLRENSLQVVQKNIEEKVETLKGLQDQLKDIVAQYEAKEDEKIKSLVKVYEAMKPQDAAKIFEQLQMSVLIEVAVHMKEAKLAQILAKMDPYKAKELTMELANRRKIKSN